MREFLELIGKPDNLLRDIDSDISAAQLIKIK